MTNTKIKKLKHNAKTTKIKCAHCNHNKNMLQSDAQYCTPLCRVQEGNYRKENGWTELLFEGKEEDIQKLYGYGAHFFDVNPLKNDLILVTRAINTYGTTQSWKLAFPDFIVYYFVNVKAKPFQIFYKESKHKILKDFEKRSAKPKSGTFKMAETKRD